MATSDTLTFRQHAADPIPAVAGVGLRHQHVPAFLEERPQIGWIEVHSENYLSEGGSRLQALSRIRRDFPVSCHGVGLSLGSAGGLDRDHLARLARLFDGIEPGLVSEHVSWCIAGGVYFNDLLPLPYTEEALDVVSRNVDHAQSFFGRQILIENPSTYLALAQSTIPEWEFLAEIEARTGCGILLDVNNVHVSARNLGADAAAFVDGIPIGTVGEIHLAGHLRQNRGGETILIDDHGSAVDPAVWSLFDRALKRFGPVPALIEWDTNVPALSVLLAEAAKAGLALDRHRATGEGAVAATFRHAS